MLNRFRIFVGDSTRGYFGADVGKTNTGKYRLFPGTIQGSEAKVRKAIANANRGDMAYVTSAGDCLPIIIR